MQEFLDDYAILWVDPFDGIMVTVTLLAALAAAALVLGLWILATGPLVGLGVPLLAYMAFRKIYVWAENRRERMAEGGTR